MQPRRYSTVPSSDIQLGLEPLTICPKKSQSEKHCNSCMMTSSVVSPSASSLIGDYIGMESCYDLDNNQEVCGGFVGGGAVVKNDNQYSGVCSRGKREQRCRRTVKRDFPPPIPSLARTDNMPSHMSWVLKRYYTSDGRLILREEKVRHQEYFRAHRSNGRLTLHLVPLDDDDEIDDIEEQEIDYEEVKVEEAQGDVFENNINNINNAEDDHKTNIVEALLKDNDIPEIEDSIVKCSIAETPTENGIASNGGKCLNYSSVRASPTCFLGLPVPAIRPVHS
ncbi:hypothetical protein DITRI_Ditri05aG0128000 [Diplodiscus trichospermus]